MITDGQTIPANTTLEADICIIGSGPAALALANELLDLPVRIIMLEAGNLTGDASSQEFLDGRDLTGEYHNPRESRHSRVGGTVGVWNTPCDGEMGAKYVPLDEIDFEKRHWVPHSGWPFPKSHLDPFYERAQALCGLGPYRFDAPFWADPKNQPFDLRSDRLATGVYQFGKASAFTANLTGRIRDSRKVECFYNVTAAELLPAPGGSTIGSLKALLARDTPIFVKARLFVLAAGGIENARLLLMSCGKHPDGLGNEHGVAGRYYMDHPIYFFTEVLPASSDIFRRSGFYDLRKVNGTWVLGRLTFSPETMRQNGLLNLSVVLYPKAPGYRSAGVEALRHLRLGLRRGDYATAARHLPGAMFHCTNILAFSRQKTPHLPFAHFWNEHVQDADPYAAFEPEFYLEQPPDPENRVTLLPETDKLGLPRTGIRWRWGAASRDNAYRMATMMDDVFQVAGMGKVRVLAHPRVSPSGHHHLGATRMHDDPKSGVVDAQCRVHGLDNLFVCGSSVFPTGGYANPTLTIVALALRLGDHLRSSCL